MTTTLCVSAALAVLLAMAVPGTVRAATSYRPLDNDCSSGYVTFTFDDGPSENTPALLDTLAGLHLKASFFVLGMNLEGRAANRAALRAEVAAGHVVGNHTYDHASVTGASTGGQPLTEQQIVQELNSTSDSVVSAGGPRPTLYRPPYGDINSWADLVARNAGYRIVMPWGSNIVDSQDWSGISPSQIASNVTSGYVDKFGKQKPGITGDSIVAMHDGAGPEALNTIDSLQSIVDFMNANHLCSTASVRDDATGGIVPPPAPPEPTTGNMVSNASLEQLKGGGPAAEPTCFQQAGANIASHNATWSITSVAHSGAVAERVDVTNWKAGDRKLVLTQRQSEKACLASVTPGQRYSLWVWYMGDWSIYGSSPTKVSIATYYRNASGTWVYWQGSPLYAPSSAWNLANFVTAPLPDGASAISYGLAIQGNGSLIVDDFAMAASA